MRHLIAAFAALLLLLPSPPARGLEAQTVVPAFGYIAPGWGAVLTAPMDDAWEAAGLPERGWNYYLLGWVDPEDASFTWAQRFNPLSPLCGAWTGAYVAASFEYGGEWASRHLRPRDVAWSAWRVAELAAADQTFWLRSFGAPEPVSSSDPPLALVVPGSLEIEKLGRRWFLVRFKMETRSDIGAAALPSPPYPPYPPFAAVDGLVARYAPVIATAEAIFTFDADEDRLMVGYLSGQSWAAPGGERTTPPGILDEQRAMLAELRFVDGVEDDEEPPAD